MALVTFVDGNVLTAAQLNDGFAAVQGLRIIKDKTTFSAVSSIIVNDIFTSDFDSYVLELLYTTSTTNLVNLNLRVAGVNASTNYNRRFIRLEATYSTSAANAQTTYPIASATQGAFTSNAVVRIDGPAIAAPTLIYSDNSLFPAAYTNQQINYFQGNHTTATAYDGFEITTPTGTISGAYTIYGLAKTGV